MTRVAMSPARWVALAVVLVLAVVWGRVFLSARAELAEAQAAESAGEMARAVEHYQYAMRWYSPLARAPTEASEALWRLGQAAEAADDRATALAAYRRLRGGILSTRSLYCPFCARLDATNDRIAALMAAEQMALGQPTIQGRSLEELERDHRALLALDPIPHPLWSLLIVGAFFGWIGGGFGTIFRGLDSDVRPVQPAFGRWLALTAVCFGLWLLGLWQG